MREKKISTMAVTSVWGGWVLGVAIDGKNMRFRGVKQFTP